MSAPPRIGPVTAAWREYRETAMSRLTPPTALRAARLAYYAASSNVLATVLPLVKRDAATDELIAVTTAMIDDLDVFLLDQAEDDEP